MKNPAILQSLKEIHRLELTLESLSSDNHSRARRLLREQDEAESRQVLTEPIELKELNGLLVWDVLSELRNEGRLRDALMKSWGDDEDETAKAARAYVWDYVFDSGASRGKGWTVYLPPQRVTYKGVPLKELGVKELRIDAHLGQRSAEDKTRRPTPENYWWLDQFVSNYRIIGLASEYTGQRPVEMKFGDLKVSPNLSFNTGPEAAVRGVNFYPDAKGQRFLDNEFESRRTIKQAEEERAKRPTSATGVDNISEAVTQATRTVTAGEHVIAKGEKRKIKESSIIRQLEFELNMLNEQFTYIRSSR
jgi:hypothetical protein